MKLICGAERHHYSMFNVERSMFGLFDVKLKYNLVRHTCNLWMFTKQVSDYGVSPRPP